ncbi:MAG: response regulator transcription factor [Bacteroidales bacterium]|nr:response regulator transcription factor [Bacteroidales bacterium]
MSNLFPKILIVEDDKNMGYLLKENMKLAGLSPVLCSDGIEGLKKFHSYPFALCILDIMLPGKDGLYLAEEIKKSNKDMPILFLTAKSQDEDKIAGFKAGCDDYVTKPFNIEELLLRIRVILRREHKSRDEKKQEILSFGNLTLNCEERKLRIGETVKNLSTKESELLKVLAINENKVVSRSKILTAVWGQDDYYVSKSLDVYLNKIRKLLSEYPNIEIMNVHGFGYKLYVKYD